jgi:hypothetical protein
LQLTLSKDADLDATPYVDIALGSRAEEPSRCASSTPPCFVDLSAVVNEADGTVRICGKISLPVLFEIVNARSRSFKDVANCLNEGGFSSSLASDNGIKPRSKFNI